MSETEKIVRAIIKPFAIVIGSVLVMVLDKNQQKQLIRYLRRRSSELKAESDQRKNGRLEVPNDF